MLKEEILMLAEQNHILLTESQLRRYIQYGLIITTKISKGKGQGVTTLFPNNTIEIVKEIEKGREHGFAARELIYYLFTNGFLVDFKKFKKSLLIDIESMLEGFEVLLEKTQDRLDRKFIIEEIALEKIPKLEPGRPSTDRLVSLNNKKKIEENKIQSILNLIEEIFKTGKVSLETSKTFTMNYGYIAQELNLNFQKNWFDTNNWIKFIIDSSEEDLEEVQQILVYIGMYQRFFKEEGLNSTFYVSYVGPLIQFYQNAGLKNFLLDPLLIKLMITLLIAEPVWRRSFFNILSLNGLIDDYVVFKQAVPLLIKGLDEQIQGGLKDNV
jgi:hypothetical protein